MSILFNDGYVFAVYKKIGAIILIAWITKNSCSHVITAALIIQKNSEL